VNPGAQFCVWPFRFRFIANEPVFFPPGKAGNVLRGAFGTIFRKLACVPECRSAAECEISDECAYASIFEPRRQIPGGPSGFSEWPRPFVFRALHLDGLKIDRGKEFHFDLVLFESPEKALPYFVLSFRDLARSGIGPWRGRALLRSVENLPGGEILYDGRRFQGEMPDGLHFDLDGNFSEKIGGLTIQFLSPTELKFRGEVVDRPEFAVLLCRLRDRISNLRGFYQGGPLDLDFEAFGRETEKVRIVKSDLRRVENDRLSSRTGQRHPLSGFIGEIEYAGEISRFIPFLKAGEWTGVGRQTVWGKGNFCIKPLTGRRD
jgi:hypothetical protein